MWCQLALYEDELQQGQGQVLRHFNEMAVQVDVPREHVQAFGLQQVKPEQMWSGW
jgi:hypothetical protein